MTLMGDANGRCDCRWVTCGLKNDIRNLVNFHASSRKFDNLHFDRILFSKEYKDLDEKIQKSYVSWYWRVMQSLNKNWLLVPNMTWSIWWFLMRAVTSLKICTLLSYFCQYYINFELKNYRRIISHYTEVWFKLWWKTGFLFEKWHEEFGEF